MLQFPAGSNCNLATWQSGGTCLIKQPMPTLGVTLNVCPSVQLEPFPTLTPWTQPSDPPPTNLIHKSHPLFANRECVGCHSEVPQLVLALWLYNLLGRWL